MEFICVNSIRYGGRNNVFVNIVYKDIISFREIPRGFKGKTEVVCRLEDSPYGHEVIRTYFINEPVSSFKYRYDNEILYPNPSFYNCVINYSRVVEGVGLRGKIKEFYILKSRNL